MAVPHYTYLVLKMPGPKGIITVKGSFELSDLCNKEFHKMAQNFGMMASYGEPNYKAKKLEYRGDVATQRKTQGTRSKETSGTATRTREDYRRTREYYRRRREDSSNIGDKMYKLAK
jgi:hypothetical protein